MISITDYKCILEYKVQWGQMDAAQHINNLEYLRWAESARVDYFKDIGIGIDFGTSKLAPILAWQECKYIFPMTYPDTAVVGVKVLEILEDRFIMETSVFSKKHKRIACVSKQSIVPYDYQQLIKVPIPDHWKTTIKLFENM